MRGFMQASGIVKVNVPNNEVKPKKALERKSDGKPHWLRCREKSVENLIATLRITPAEFTACDLKALGRYRGNAMFYRITQLSDLGLIVRVGKHTHSPVFKLNADLDTIATVLLAEGVRTHGVSREARKELRAKQIRVDMVNFLARVGNIFNTTELRDAMGCYASVACSRVNIMLREGLIEPFESEKWMSSKARTYKKVTVK